MTGVGIALLATLLVLPVPPEGYAPPPPPVARTAGGFEFVDRPGPRFGHGIPRTYRLEVEPATRVDTRAFTYLAERILSDERGWTGVDDWSLRRVRRRPDIRVVLATPATVDRLCARAGLRTAGRYSCWNGRVAALNVTRWQQGADAFAGSLRRYRRYVLNHEVGHALGYRHRSCPRRGARAPVMQQQTKGSAPCRANGWPKLDP